MHSNTLLFCLFLIGELKSATSGPVKKIGDMLRRHPENFIPDQETAFLKVASGCCAYSDVFWISTTIITDGRDFLKIFFKLMRLWISLSSE